MSRVKFQDINGNQYSFYAKDIEQGFYPVPNVPKIGYPEPIICLDTPVGVVPVYESTWMKIKGKKAKEKGSFKEMYMKNLKRSLKQVLQFIKLVFTVKSPDQVLDMLTTASLIVFLVCKQSIFLYAGLVCFSVNFILEIIQLIKLTIRNRRK